MAKKEAHISQLQDYLPPNTFEPVLAYLQHYHVHLTVARDRKSILGDYRHKVRGQNHRISVNGSLNKYSFLITLLHELAHLLTFEKFGHRAAAHGKEWKSIFGELLARFIEQKVFPEDIRSALLQSIHDPAASSCADETLLRTLRKYNEVQSHLVFVETMPEGCLFRTYDGKVFRKGEKMRKRFRCVEVKTRRIYLFSPVYEAELVKKG
ncbi:MAG: SprT-like domain-containing protein [Flavisolibacter sp.]